MKILDRLSQRLILRSQQDEKQQTHAHTHTTEKTLLSYKITIFNFSFWHISFNNSAFVIFAYAENIRQVNERNYIECYERSLGNDIWASGCGYFEAG